mmetsp:Transcript_31196/g.92863  ORF Transcript_31196/g.92863 Transcript_31196/m.92863 type:complete len:215 (+) Transcript_31196:1082-1726(+)
MSPSWQVPRKKYLQSSFLGSSRSMSSGPAAPGSTCEKRQSLPKLQRPRTKSRQIPPGIMPGPGGAGMLILGGSPCLRSSCGPWANWQSGPIWQTPRAKCRQRTVLYLAGSSGSRRSGGPSPPPRGDATMGCGTGPMSWEKRQALPNLHSPRSKSRQISPVRGPSCSGMRGGAPTDRSSSFPCAKSQFTPRGQKPRSKWRHRSVFLLGCPPSSLA